MYDQILCSFVFLLLRSYHFTWRGGGFWCLMFAVAPLCHQPSPYLTYYLLPTRATLCVCVPVSKDVAFIYDDEFPMLSGLQLPISGNNRPTLQSPPRLLKYSLIVMDPDYYLLACPLAFPCLPEEVHVGREHSFIPLTTDVVLGDTIFCLQ